MFPSSLVEKTFASCEYVFNCRFLGTPLKNVSETVLLSLKELVLKCQWGKGITLYYVK